MASGKESVLDLTLVSYRLAHRCEWSVHRDSAIGSDHYPVWCKVKMKVVENMVKGEGKWFVGKANWTEFKAESDRLLNLVSGELDRQVRGKIYETATRAIPKSRG